jgi:hypothetical protein
MDLLNLLEHKKNTKILVNGTVYTIGPDGVLKDVKDEDAKALLQIEKVWKVYDPKRAAELKAQAKAAAKGKIQLVGPTGPIPRDDKPGDPMDPNFAVYKRPDPVSTIQKSEDPKTVPAKDETEATPEAAPEEDEVSGEQLQGEAEANDEWPDPDESMDVDFLRQMAEAYEVTFNARTSKKTLVKRISAAMYE